MTQNHAFIRALTVSIQVSMETTGVLPGVLSSAISGMSLASEGAGLLPQPLEALSG